MHGTECVTAWLAYALTILLRMVLLLMIISVLYRGKLSFGAATVLVLCALLRAGPECNLVAGLPYHRPCNSAAPPDRPHCCCALRCLEPQG